MGAHREDLSLTLRGGRTVSDFRASHDLRGKQTALSLLNSYIVLVCAFRTMQILWQGVDVQIERAGTAIL